MGIKNYFSKQRYFSDIKFAGDLEKLQSTFYGGFLLNIADILGINARFASVLTVFRIKNYFFKQRYFSGIKFASDLENFNRSDFVNYKKIIFQNRGIFQKANSPVI